MQPKNHPFEEHNISPKNIDSHAFYVIEKLRSKGFVAYLVGGSVRDLLLKEVPKDFDISTSAEPQQIKNIFRNCILIGRRFRLAHIRFGKKVFEVSTFRTGNISTSELIIRDNEWGSAEDDVLRRDFTINGLFYDTENQNIIDYVGGFDDAKKRLLRSIGDSKIRFIQDPVRMIRLLKFKARFNFNIEESTLAALDICRKEILKSSQARIFEELLKMLSSGASEEFFKLLHKFKLLELLLPTLATYLDAEKDVYLLLKQIDIYTCKHQREPLDRAISVSCLIFPILDKKIQAINTKIHLGVIAKETREIINEVIGPFFQISKKIKAMIISILINQYRFIPLNPNVKNRRIRIPRDPFFNLSMEFLKLRSLENHELLPTYDLWYEHLINTHSKQKKQPLKNKKYYIRCKKQN